jgi:antitoxin MazE
MTEAKKYEPNRVVLPFPAWLTQLSICDYNVITLPSEELFMKTRLVRIGNSRGIRLPKAIIAQAGLTDEVELGVREGAIIIARATFTRSGWADAARQMHQRDDDRLLDPDAPTLFNDKEWEW